MRPLQRGPQRILFLRRARTIAGRFCLVGRGQSRDVRGRRLRRRYRGSAAAGWFTRGHLGTLGDDVGICTDVSVVEARLVTELFDDGHRVPYVVLGDTISRVGPDEEAFFGWSAGLIWRASLRLTVLRLRCVWPLRRRCSRTWSGTWSARSATLSGSGTTTVRSGGLCGRHDDGAQRHREEY